MLADVHVRGAAVLTLGFPSGHAAVAAGLAIAASAYVTRRIRSVGIAVAVVVAFARVYVGAHFPLDVIGGAALGATVASVVHLVLGVPRRSRANREGP